MNSTKENTSEKGSRHWWLQRISALVLIPLTLWFVFAILGHIDDSHRAATQWIAQPGVAIALVVYLIFLFFHTQLGLQVIIEDYVSSPKTRHKTLLAMKVINGLGGVIAVFSVLRILVG